MARSFIPNSGIPHKSPRQINSMQRTTMARRPAHKNFLQRMWEGSMIQDMCDDWMGRILLILLTICMILFLGMLTAIVIYFGDNIHATVEQGEGVVLRHEYSPAYTTYSTTTVNGVTTTTPIYVPESYELIINV